MTFNEVHCSFTIMIAHNLSKGKAMCQKHIQFNRHMLDIRDYSHIMYPSHDMTASQSRA